MTEEQVARARILISTRESIRGFLSARDPNSKLCKREIADATTDWQKEEAHKLPTTKVAEISLRDTDDIDEQDDQSILSYNISRDILDRALEAELPRIADELKALGVTSVEEKKS